MQGEIDEDADTRSEWVQGRFVGANWKPGKGDRQRSRNWFPDTTLYPLVILVPPHNNG